VYRYTAGKADWLAAGLPTEGTHATRALDIAMREAPTCAPTDMAASALARARDAGWDVCVVLNGHGVVLGMLQAGSDGDVPAEDVMVSAPASTRADTSPATALERMDARGVDVLLVTDPDGRLLGVLRRAEAAARGS
jgi:CBS domain-containing protein